MLPAGSADQLFIALNAAFLAPVLALAILGAFAFIRLFGSMFDGSKS